MTTRRDRKRELAITAKAANLLRAVGRAYPHNPCDTKALFFLATQGDYVRSKVVLALDDITAGPHVDFDYLVEAEELLNDAEKHWAKMTAAYSSS